MKNKTKNYTNIIPEKNTTPIFKDTEGYVPPRKKKINPFFVLFTAIILLIIMLTLILFMYGKKTIYLNDYLISPKYIGYNNNGTVFSSGFDKNSFLNDYEDSIFFSNNAEYDDTGNSMYVYYYKSWGYSAAETLYDIYIKPNIIFTPDSNLSTGDIITCRFEFTEEELEEVEKYFKVKFKYDDNYITYTVSNLEDMTTVDIFSDIEITYGGKVPNAYIASIDNNSTNEAIKNLEFEYTPSFGIENGTTITISISDSDAEYLTNKYGIVPTSTSTEITVEGLDSYITRLSQIPDETMEKIKSQSESVLNAEIASDWSEYENLEGITFLGCYFLTPIDSTKYGNQTPATYLNMVYKIDVHLYDEAEALDYSFSYYTLVTFYDIMLLSDGTCSVDLSNCDLATNEYYIDSPTDLSTYSFYYYGYADLKSLFNECVASNSDSFNYETTVEDQ